MITVVICVPEFISNGVCTGTALPYFVSDIITSSSVVGQVVQFITFVRVCHDLWRLRGVVSLSHFFPDIIKKAVKNLESA